MVSQPSNALTLQGPPSAVGSSRNRRHGRTNPGGRSYQSQNEFPIFSSTGDVEIIVRAGPKTNRYLLHRLYLAQCSGFFEASTSEEWSRAGHEVGGALAPIGESPESETSSTTGGAKKRWRYELDKASNANDHPVLVQKDASSSSLFGNDNEPPPVRNKPHPSSNPSFFRSVVNLSLLSNSPSPFAPAISQADQELLNDYDNLFCIFYNYTPALDAIDIATAYNQCKSLLALADLYHALGVVGPRIDHHLLQFQSRLWKHIAKYPASYLKVGYLAQSKSIFQEALIHVVGAWPAGERHLRHQLSRSVLDLIEDKVEDLEDAVGKIERRLFRLTLTNLKGERITPYNSCLDWLVMSLFRQWLAENTSASPAPPLPRSRAGASSSQTQPHGRSISTQRDLTHSKHSNNNREALPTPPNLGRIYRILGSSSSSPTSSAYLTHNECKKFLRLFPNMCNRKSVLEFEKRLEEVKAMASEVVKPLMRSELLGDSAAVDYLTCTKVRARDFIWA